MHTELIEKQQLVDNIWSFKFKTSEPLTWVAGQYAEVELSHNPADEGGTKRFFTNSAAPYEGIYQITTRISESSFKQALLKLGVGDRSLKLVSQPEGDFVWQDSEKPLVFIAGGIGITPFYSILKQRIHDGLSINATLVYGSRTAEVAFKNELDEWASKGLLKVQYEVGTRLDASSLSQIVPDFNNHLVYISGPEPMVEALGNDLTEHGLPKNQLKQDYFPYYDETNY